jgi:chromosome segregation ATPase
MKELDLNPLIREVRKTYKAFEKELQERINLNDQIIKEHKEYLAKLVANIEYREKEIESIKSNNKNYYGENKKFSLLIEKERDIKKLEKLIEDQKNEKVNLESLIKDLEEDLSMQNKEDNKAIEKLNKEKKKIIESLIDQQLYDKNIKLVVDKQELAATVFINDNLTKEQ